MVDNTANTAPLLNEPEPFKKRAAKNCGLCICGTFSAGFIVVWIWQGLAYWYGLNFSCTASSLQGYKYANGDDTNIVPEITLLAQRSYSKYGKSFDVIPSNEASSVNNAPIGVWWRTWGPLFNTYIYEDVLGSNTIVYMRRNLLRLGMSHKIGRCDGKGEEWIMYEGSNWFSNRIRHVFGLNQGWTFKLYQGGTFVGLVKETNKGAQSMTVFDEENNEIGSGVLQQRHFHGDKDLWLAKTKESTKIPAWVSESITVLFAFAELNQKERDAAAAANVPGDNNDYPPKAQLLAATDDSSDFALPLMSEPAGDLPLAEDASELSEQTPRLPIVDKEEQVEQEHV